LRRNGRGQPLPPDDLFRCEHIPLKKGACWRDLGVLSADKTRTTKPFKWMPLDNAKVRNRPDNNTHPHSDKLPAGAGRDPNKCIVPQYCVNKAQATTLLPSKAESKKGAKSLARLWWDEIFTTWWAAVPVFRAVAVGLAVIVPTCNSCAGGCHEADAEGTRARRGQHRPHDDPLAQEHAPGPVPLLLGAGVRARAGVPGLVQDQRLGVQVLQQKVSHPAS
jgi:hypothetical protein